MFHGSNQPTYDGQERPIPDTSFNISMTTNNAGKSREEWNTYRLDWIPGQSSFYLNGVQLAQTGKNVPFEESRLIISMFGNGGSWSGPMEVGMDATLEVQWIQFAFNSTSASPGSDGVICNIDDPDFMKDLPPPDSIEDSGQPHSAVPFLKLIVLFVSVYGIIIFF